MEGGSKEYQVYLPAGHTVDKSWPVILFLHGAGERGTDGWAPTHAGLGKALRERERLVDAVVVFPQCDRIIWTTEMERFAMRAVENTVKEFNGDSNRVYVTGMSMGGMGVWRLIARSPERFAAALPICGEISALPFLGPLPIRLARLKWILGFLAAGAILIPGAFVCRLRRVPFGARQAALTGGGVAMLVPVVMWIADGSYTRVARLVGRLPILVVHGDADTVIPVNESRRLVDALRREGGDVRYIEYPGVGHNCWDQTYADRATLEWLLSQRKGAASQHP